MEKEYSPVSYSEAKHYVDIAQKLPRDEAEVLQRVIMRRAQEAGVCSDSIWPLIYSITERFADEDREMRKKIMEEDLRQKGIMTQQKIEADDNQIVLAIKWTLPRFKSDWDWGGIYRILVDFCDFPSVKTKFVTKLADLRIYPKDNYVIIKDRLTPSIYQDEYHGHPFSYQAVQRGCPFNWPATYDAWKNSMIQTNDFSDRKTIAALFLNNLIKATKEQ